MIAAAPVVREGDALEPGAPVPAIGDTRPVASRRNFDAVAAAGYIHRILDGGIGHGGVGVHAQGGGKTQGGKQEAKGHGRLQSPS